MVPIGNPASLWVQCMNSCFFASGFFGDLLVLRFLLMCAYIFLLVNVFTGYPMWPRLWNTKEEYTLSLDSLIWGACNLYLHGSSFVGIFRDERYVKLDESMEPLWCMMYRKSGISALVFKQYVEPKFEVVHLSKDATISDEDGEDGSGGSIYIILDGATRTTDSNGNSMVVPSGGVVGLRHLHLFSHRGRDKAFEHMIVHAGCLTEVTAYRCTKKDIEKLATTSQTQLAWQALLIYGLTEFSEHVYDSKNTQSESGGADADDNNNDNDNDGIAVIAVERNDVFGPLEDWEQPNQLAAGSGRAARRPLKHLIKSAVDTFLPPWPFYKWVPALRHGKLPAPHFMPAAAAAETGTNLETPGRSDFPGPISDPIDESFTETVSETVTEITTTLTATSAAEAQKGEKSDLEQPLLPK